MRRQIFHALKKFGFVMGAGLAVMSSNAMAQATYIGEVRWFAFNFCPVGWAKADGHQLSIGGSTALFSLIGTTYGGDGKTTFNVPDLRGRVPVGVGAGPGLTPKTLGQRAGRETVTLTSTQLPKHSHSASTKTQLRAFSGPADSNDPAQNPLAGSGSTDIYKSGNTTANISMASSSAVSTTTVSDAGSGAPVHIDQPSLALTPCIAVVGGNYPSRPSNN